jgi:fatty-acid desaturase
MAFIERILEEPSYGWKDEEGKLVKPSNGTIVKEALSRMNIIKDRKNWMSMMSWGMILSMTPFLFLFLFKYFSIWLLLGTMAYAMIIISTHGTIWYHRYCTHRAYEFKSPFWRFITQNLVIKTFPEEIYVISHHVHHALSDEPGDPYNSLAGYLYCMLSDVNHQSIAKDLTEEEFKKVSMFMDHTGVKCNTYAQYQKWGSVATIGYTLRAWLLNWAFWFTVLTLIGGPGLACALFTGAMMWYALVPAFNYNGHGKGQVEHKDGIDYDRTNLSINQTRPGLFSGEWHNNHHLFPRSARAGFLPYQIDLAWIYIYCLNKIGGVSSYRDAKPLFLKKYAPEYIKGEKAASKAA